MYFDDKDEKDFRDNSIQSDVLCQNLERKITQKIKIKSNNFYKWL
jgi:hypothetical protein